MDHLKSFCKIIFRQEKVRLIELTNSFYQKTNLTKGTPRIWKSPYLWPLEGLFWRFLHHSEWYMRLPFELKCYILFYLKFNLYIFRWLKEDDREFNRIQQSLT